MGSDEKACAIVGDALGRSLTAEQIASINSVRGVAELLEGPGSSL